MQYLGFHLFSNAFVYCLALAKWHGIDSAITQASETLHCVNMTQHNKLIDEKAQNIRIDIHLLTIFKDYYITE